jgi:hypothetical protein
MDQNGQIKERINALSIFQLFFEPVKLLIRQKQILTDRSLRYIFHILLMKMEHCIDAQ